MKSDFSLSVQYASLAQNLPPRHAFRRWIRAAILKKVGITIRIVDEEEGLELNRLYRGRDYATNVLTFVYDEFDPVMGDMVLCAPVIEREALAQSKSLESHYAHMSVHGALHLQGYDHENESDAATMEALEAKIMARLGYQNPYGV
ncbi:MAG: rRNA maturation RNase YbeY [Burkholderiales bacterium]|nr:rRNA maturation RNase YbeY [Burkholderiales bacterium]